MRRLRSSRQLHVLRLQRSSLLQHTVPGDFSSPSCKDTTTSLQISLEIWDQNTKPNCKGFIYYCSTQCQVFFPHRLLFAIMEMRKMVIFIICLIIQYQNKQTNKIASCYLPTINSLCHKSKNLQQGVRGKSN